MAAFHARYALYRGLGACLLLLPLSNALASDLVTLSMQGHVTYHDPTWNTFPSIGIGTAFRATFTYNPSIVFSSDSETVPVSGMTCRFDVGQYSISGPVTVQGLALAQFGTWDCAYSSTAPAFLLWLAGDPSLFTTLNGRQLPTSVPAASLLNPICYTNDQCYQVQIHLDGGEGYLGRIDTITSCVAAVACPTILSPSDGASPQSQFVALSGTGTPGDTLDVLVDGGAIGINGVVVDSEGNWEALAYVGGRAAPLVKVRDRTSFVQSNAITVHPLQAGFAGPPVPGNLFTAILPLRRADIFVDGDTSSPQVVLYGPTYTHTAVYLGGDSDGTPWIAEAVTASEAGIWGQVRSVLLEHSLVWKANRVSAFKPILPLSLATRSAIVSWASNITIQGLPYWNSATDLTGPILGADAVFVATGGLLSSRFNGFLGLLNSNKNSTTKFICSTLVWRAYWEGTGHTLDISDPNLMSIAPGSLLSNLNPILSTQFLIQLSPVFVVPETFVRSPKLRQIF